MSQGTTESMEESNKSDEEYVVKLEHMLKPVVHRISENVVAIRQQLQQQLHSDINYQLQQKLQRILEHLKQDLKTR